jgi:hypothetical protein
MASNITVDTLTKGSTTLNTDEIVDTNSNQICKAWVLFDSSGTGISDSFNVSSVTSTTTPTTGYIINFTTAFANTDYCVVVSGSAYSGGATNYSTGAINRTTTGVNIHRENATGASSEPHDAGVVVFSN